MQGSLQANQREYAVRFRGVSVGLYHVGKVDDLGGQLERKQLGGFVAAAPKKIIPSISPDGLGELVTASLK